VLVDTLDAQTRQAPYEIAMRVLLEQGIDVNPTVMGRAEWDSLVSRERRIARDIEREGIAL
jgi:phage-related baseplate assembly protein